MRLPTETEQKLVDIALQLAIISAKYMHDKSTEEVAIWAAHQLNECGFKNKPIGSSWAVLTEVKGK